MKTISLGRAGKARPAMQTKHQSQLCVQLTLELEVWPRIRAFHKGKTQGREYIGLAAEESEQPREHL